MKKLAILLCLALLAALLPGAALAEELAAEEAAPATVEEAAPEVMPEAEPEPEPAEAAEEAPEEAPAEGPAEDEAPAEEPVEETPEEAPAEELREEEAADEFDPQWLTDLRTQLETTTYYAVSGKPFDLAFNTYTSVYLIRLKDEEGLCFFDENSSDTYVYRQWRSWGLRPSVSDPGDRLLSLWYRQDGSTTDYLVGSLRVIVYPKVLDTDFSDRSEEYLVGEEVPFTVRTREAATKLYMYAEERGKPVKTWEASGNSTVSGGTRTWNVSYAFKGTGTRYITFLAGMGLPGEKAAFDDLLWDYAQSGKEESVIIVKQRTPAPPDVTSVSPTSVTALVNEEVSFTVKTPAEAKFLALYSGSTKAKVWGMTGNSTVSGDTRTWNVKYAFKSKGIDRVITFKCAAKTEYGEGKDTKVTVNAAVPAVISASPAYTTAAVNQEITYTVKTPSNAKFLALYSGSSKLKVWGMTGNSTLSGSIRVWTVSYAFKGAGIKRVVSFKCSANGTYGTGKSVAATIAGRFLTQGTTQKISGYGELTVKWADDMYSLGILSSGSTTDGVVKKTSYDYGHFKGLCVYIKNLSSTAHDFTANCSVKVILNGATTYEGFLHMFNPNVDIDAIRSGGWINYVSKRVMMNDADIYPVPAGETGQYCFICDLPNTALSSDAGPLVMYITLDGKTFAYTLR